MFTTSRLNIFCLAPQQAARLFGSLVADTEVARTIPWIRGKSKRQVDEEVLRIELLCGAGSLRLWGVQRREDGILVGTIIETPSLTGCNLEAIFGRSYWNFDFGSEALEPLLNWIGT